MEASLLTQSRRQGRQTRWRCVQPEVMALGGSMMTGRRSRHRLQVKVDAKFGQLENPLRLRCAFGTEVETILFLLLNISSTGPRRTVRCGKVCICCGIGTASDRSCLFKTGSEIDTSRFAGPKLLEPLLNLEKQPVKTYQYYMITKI